MATQNATGDLLSSFHLFSALISIFFSFFDCFEANIKEKRSSRIINHDEKGKILAAIESPREMCPPDLNRFLHPPDNDKRINDAAREPPDINEVFFSALSRER
jgi:hypothetical protein